MITIPLSIFFFLYLFFIAVFFIFFLVNLYHVFASASFTFLSFLVTILVITGATLILVFTFDVLKDIDWSIRVTLFSTEWLSLFKP